MADVPPADRSQSQPVPLVLVPDQGRLTAALPSPPTSFVGREREVTAVADLLRHEDARLVTLTGPGGVGKTRLALRVAEQLASTFADDVAFVPLAALANPDLVLPTIAQALGIREGSDPPSFARLARALRDRHMLLVMDNLEHLLEAAPLLAEVLSSCPRLTVLATSRALLRISGEQVYPVPPLGLPQTAAEADGVRDSEAVELFVQRARAVDPSFALSEANSASMAAICACLDGLPLAIELAAARLRHLTLPALLARLEPRLPFLTGGPRDLPARQQTMRAAIAWSHDLLTPEEQAFFGRLAVFACGFTLDAAESVAGDGRRGTRTRRQASEETENGRLSSSPVPRLSSLDGIATLVDHHLVQLGEGADGEPRFGMLETIREFALEQLEASDEAEEARRRHAAFFLALAERAAPALNGPEQAAWLDLLEAERENLRAALAWLRRTGDQAGLLRLAWAVWRFWRIRGYFGEGRAWLEEAANLADHDHSLAGLRAAALYGAGWLAVEQGDQRSAKTHGEASLAIARRLADQLGVARALGLLGWLAHRATDYQRARTLMGEALALNRAIGDDDGIAGSLNNLAITTMDLGEFDEAAALFAEAKEIFERRGNQHGTAGALDNLGVALYCQGDVTRAEALAQEALDLYRRLGARNSIAIALDHVGRCACRRNDYRRAWERHLESLPLRREVGDPRGIAVWLEAVALLIAACGCPEPAARILGSAAALREATGFHHYAHESSEHERLVANLRAALGPDRFSLSWTAGRAMTPDQAIADAIAVATEAVSSAAATPAPPREPAPFGLTSREQDVLRLLARRYTDREVAEALFISPRTVGRHVVGIFNKLGVHSRREAAAVATRNHLV